ncbi:MAG TPA: hypothetical protein VFP55_13525 [Solirubrobacteraceae bacterium]|nr:hypothetical protein [Solirubrobacteraceae bacterium]
MIESLRCRAGRFGLDIILVDVWEGAGAAEEAAGYCSRWGLEGTVLLDETAEYARQLGVRGVPTNVFVDQAGVVRAFGASTFDDLLNEACRLEPRLADDADVIRAERKPSDFE